MEYNYLTRLAVSLDQLVNVLLGGQEDNTLSSRAWIRSQDSEGWYWVRRTIDTLFFFDPNHCRESFLTEYRKRAAWKVRYQKLYDHTREL